MGDELTIRQGSANHYTQKTVKVLALSEVRGNATAASVLYQETDASIVNENFSPNKKNLPILPAPIIAQIKNSVVSWAALGILTILAVMKKVFNWLLWGHKNPDFPWHISL